MPLSLRHWSIARYIFTACVVRIQGGMNGGVCVLRGVCLREGIKHFNDPKKQNDKSTTHPLVSSLRP